MWSKKDLKMWLQIMVANEEGTCSALGRIEGLSWGKLYNKLINHIFAKEETPIFKDNKNNFLAELPYSYFISLLKLP